MVFSHVFQVNRIYTKFWWWLFLNNGIVGDFYLFSKFSTISIIFVIREKNQYNLIIFQFPLFVLYPPTYTMVTIAFFTRKRRKLIQISPSYHTTNYIQNHTGNNFSSFQNPVFTGFLPSSHHSSPFICSYVHLFILSFTHSCSKHVSQPHTVLGAENANMSQTKSCPLGANKPGGVSKKGEERGQHEVTVSKKWARKKNLMQENGKCRKPENTKNRYAHLKEEKSNSLPGRQKHVSDYGRVSNTSMILSTPNPETPTVLLREASLSSRLRCIWETSLRSSWTRFWYWLSRARILSAVILRSLRRCQ